MGRHYQPDIFAYLKAGDSDLKSLVKSRLRFLALTRSETNVFFNPHDGRRLCDTRGVYNDNDCVHDDDRLLDVPCDDLDGGDASLGENTKRQLFIGQFIVSSCDAAEPLSGGKRCARKSAAIAVQGRLSAMGTRKTASQLWLAWMESLASGPGLFLKCLLYQKWVLEDVANDTPSYSGFHGKSGPLNAKDHYKT